MYSIIIRMLHTENAVVDFGRLGLRPSGKKKQAKNRHSQGQLQSKFEGRTVCSGAENFSKIGDKSMLYATISNTFSE